MLAGRAVVGFYSALTGDIYWFNLRRYGEDKVWQIYGLHNPRLETHHLGTVFGDNHDRYDFRYKPSTLREGPVAKKYIEVFDFSFKAIINNKVPNTMKIYHEGVCGYCGKPLRDPHSMDIGIGPVCRKQLGI